MIRNFWFYLWFFPLSIFFCSLSIVVRPLFREGVAGMWCGSRWSWLCLFFACVRVEIDLSKAPDPKDGAVIFMPNHSSNLDILVLYSYLRAWWIGFVAKRSLFSIPLFGQALAAAGHVPIDRDNPRKAMKAIDYAAAQTEKGCSIVIFPEGTRSKNPGEMGEFQIGGMIMALKCGKPVVPLVIEGTERILPSKKMFLGKWYRVRVVALDPIMPGKYDIKEREQFKNDLREMMNKKFLEMRNE